MESLDGTSDSVSEEELPVFSLTAQEQENVLRACHPDIKNMLDYDQIFPYLNRHRLLTSSDQEELDTLPHRGQKIDWLVRSLPRKGSEAVWKFLDSLKCTVDGTAHAELMSLLQEHVENIKDRRTTLMTRYAEVLWWLKRGLVILLLLSAAMFFVWPYRSTLLSAAAYHFNLRIHSKSLPYPTEHFMGRKKEMGEVTQLISFDNTDVRVVSIVGPPGIGKTTIAIHIGHVMVERGVSVYYVDMVEASSMQTLAEKVLESTDTLVSTKNVTVKRLLKWAGDLQHNTLLLLDNCDDVLREQEDQLRKVVKQLLMASPHIKVLTTSRQRTLQLGKFQLYELYELPVEASCSLLQTVAKMTRTECEKIAQLTGSVPLALQVVGALLSQPDSPEPKTIVAQLEEQLIPTLSPEELPPEERVNVSINLSYQFLGRRLQKIGRYLANFPGSFDRDGACGVLQSLAKNHITCGYIFSSVSQLVRRSLLEFNPRKSRFQFHTLIRQFFLDTQKLIEPTEPHKFSAHFQLHYSKVLQYLNTVYDTDHMQALRKLDLERHLIQHLLSEAASHRIPFGHKQYLSIMSAIKGAIRSRYLNSRFTVEELHAPLRKLVDHLYLILREFSKHNHRVKPFVTSYVILLLSSDIELAYIEDQLDFPQFQSIKLLSKHMKVLEREDIQSIAAREATFEYSLMYHKLSNYYSDVNDPQHVNECHAKILKMTELTDCEPAQCSSTTIGLAYYHAQSYKDGVRFLEQSYEEVKDDLIARVSILYKLRRVYLYLDDVPKAEENLAQIVALFPELMSAPASTIYKHTSHLQSVIEVYKETDRMEYAISLGERLVEAISEIGAKTSVASEVKDLAEYIWKQRNYTKLAELAQFGRESMKHLSRSQWQASTGLRLDLEILIGRSKFHAGNYSEGLDYLEKVMDNIYKLGPSAYPTQYKVTCPYVLIRFRFGCVQDGMSYIGTGIMYLVFSLLVDPAVPVVIHQDQHSASPAQVAYTSSKTALALVEDTLAVSRAFWTLHQFIEPQLASWFESLSLWIKKAYNGLRSWFLFASQPVLWALQFSVVRFIVNVVWVYVKLMIVLYIFKWLHFFLLCSYIICLILYYQTLLYYLQFRMYFI